MILLPDRAYTEKELRILLEHEANHIMAKDLLWRMFGIVILCIHWFNPLVWLMCGLMNRDIELACDEGVLRHFGQEARGRVRHDSDRNGGKETRAAAPV